VRLNGVMNLVFRSLTVTALLGAVASTAFALPNPTEVIQAKGGPIKITPIYHASLQIEFRGKVIQVDPFSAGDYSGAKKADLILITHTHADHLDLKAIGLVRKQNAFTAMIMPSAAAKIVLPSLRLRGANPVFTLGNAQSKTVDGIRVEAVPAYNIVRGPKPGQKFHPKGEFNGYVLTLGGERIYIAGDTEAIPEMKALKNIDVAFLPMNLPYTMTPQEAAVGAKAFKPKVVYPYHYRFPFTKPNDNPQQFQKALEGSGIQVRIRGWYAHPAAK
jgi:L-ascorbate metabolism protein UlaG (beta-lactamase superfamily)